MKAPSLRVAVLRTAVFRSLRSNRSVIGACVNVVCARAQQKLVEVPEVLYIANNKAQGKQCKTKQCVLKLRLCVHVLAK